MIFFVLSALAMVLLALSAHTSSAASSGSSLLQGYQNFVGPGWTLADTGDFNGDGKTDLLWRNTSGAFSEWQSTGSGFTSNVYTSSSVDNTWTLAAVADFNGDGKADLLWFQASTGTFTIWSSTGTGFTPNTYIGTVGSGWTPAGVGDFNGDGKADLVWWNASSSQFSIWSSTDSGFTPNAYVGEVTPGYTLAAVADFNGDGKADLLWFQASTGTLTEWQSVGSSFTPNVYQGSVSPGWTLAGTGDFNGEGKADILWFNASTSAFSVWDSTGTGFTPNAYQGSITPGMAIVGVGDFNGDGMAGFLTFNASAGAFAEWQSTTPPTLPQLPIHSNDGNIEVDPIGTPQIVFDYATAPCPVGYIPDTPVRAFRDANGNVNLLSEATTNYRFIGPALDSVQIDCTPIMRSADNTSFNAFTYHEWIHSPYTEDGQTIYALVHNEWYPSLLYPQCAAGAAVSTTLAISTDGGATFSHPGDYLVRTAVSWDASFSCTANDSTDYGSWDPSNIIKKDGYYYVFFNNAADPNDGMDTAICLGRTQNLAVGSSWQVWTANGWASALTTPQCLDLFGQVGSNETVMYVSYNTYLGSYVALRNNNYDQIEYQTSQDLIHWSDPVIFLKQSPRTWQLSYGAILDPNDTSRNFEDSGQTAYLYFTWDHTNDPIDPNPALGRDLIRQEIKFTKLATAALPPVLPPLPSLPTPPPVVNTVSSATGGGSVVAVTATSSTPVAVTSRQQTLPALTLLFSRGSMNAQVPILQKMLNSDPGTVIAISGAGSPGEETSYFGTLTQVAVQKFQTKYGVVSSGTPATTGYGAVGPRTRAKLNALYAQ
ncbi:MAG TPA: FG-GAP-like repeat-containing protein [Candidatus Paceibacterota bacterium]|nr:FG-GAP-like repeat-containing protein [Candidatus Paceibacterota bacterium]